MALTLVTGPTIEPVTLEEIKDHLRISSTVSATEDTMLLALITVARDYCERFQNRAFMYQTWDYVFDAWPKGNSFFLPRPPLVSVTSVYYYSTGGTSNTMTSSTYIVDTDNEPGRVVLGYSEVWPTETLWPAKAIRVRFLAGYGNAASAVPLRVKQAIKSLVGHLYEHREATDIKEITEVPYGVEALLWPDRVVPI